MTTQYWLPIFDHELEAVAKCFPEAKPVQRNGVWHILLLSRSGLSAEEMARVVQQTIAEETAGHALPGITRQ